MLRKRLDEHSVLWFSQYGGVCSKDGLQGPLEKEAFSKLKNPMAL